MPRFFMQQIPENYPEEYIKWIVNFFWRDFFVTPDVLIPRLETESLVRRARVWLRQKMEEKTEIEILRKNKMKAQNGESEGDKLFESDENKWQMSRANEFLSLSGAFGTFQSWKVHEEETGLLRTSQWQKSIKTIVIDIGCGSGIIGTSVADLADEVIFLDISPEALEVAEHNFRTHFPEKKAQFIVSDLLSALPITYHLSPITYLFVTNLPYIKDEDWKNMSEDTIHEPRVALFGWEKTGFELYEKLFTQFASLPFTLHCLFEFGFDQREIAEIELKKYPQWKYSFFADYAGIERFGEIISKN